MVGANISSLATAVGGCFGLLMVENGGFMRKFLAFAALLVIGCGGGDVPRLMVKSGPEPAGTNCTNGGVIIQTGYDDNDNGVLDAGEISDTQYVCHGEDGSQGPDGAQGPKGDVGETGEPGQDGEDGAPGEKGICADNAKPTVNSITFEQLAPFTHMRVGVSYEMYLDFDDDDGDEVEVFFSGDGATIEATDQANTYRVTPIKVGGPFQFVVILNDGCQVTTESFIIDKTVRINGLELGALVAIGKDSVHKLNTKRKTTSTLGQHGQEWGVGLEYHPVDGNLYYYSTQEQAFYRIDLPNVAAARVASVPNVGNFADFTFGPDGTVYTVTEMGWLSIDLETREYTVLNDMAKLEWKSMHGLAYASGYIYGFSGFDFYRISLAKQQVEFVGRIKCPEGFGECYLLNGLAFNPENGRFLSTMALGSYPTSLVSIDLDALTMTELMAAPEASCSVAAPLLDTVAPGTVTDVKVVDKGCNWVDLGWKNPDDVDFMYTWIRWGDGSQEVVSAFFDSVFIEGLAPNTKYSFLINAFDMEGNVSDGVTFEVTTSDCPAFGNPGAMYVVSGTKPYNGYLYAVDLETMAATLVGNLGLKEVDGMAINGAGEMYVVSNVDKHLYKVNIETAKVTDVGNVGRHVYDLGFDFEGVLYALAKVDGGGALDLFTIDTATGASTRKQLVEWEDYGQVAVAFSESNVVLKDGNEVNVFKLSNWLASQTKTISPILQKGWGEPELSANLATGANGYFYSVQNSDDSFSYLYIIDSANNWTAHYIGVLPVFDITAIDFLKP